MRQTLIYLYIFVFKDEPLIKVGCTTDVVVRAKDLGLHRFSLQDSYALFGISRKETWTLERLLKNKFSDRQIVSVYPLPDGNSETFSASIVPEVLQWIDSIILTQFPSLRIQHNISWYFQLVTTVAVARPKKRKYGRQFDRICPIWETWERQDKQTSDKEAFNAIATT